MNKSRSIALISSAYARTLDIDLPPLVRAFADRGITAEIIDWDNADEDWSRFSSAIVRSPWDYHRRFDEFLEFLTRVSTLTTLHNSEAMIRWNLDKHYLSEMVADGIEIVPTTFIEDESGIDAARELLAGDVVVKPTISAGANNSWRHTDDLDGALAHVHQILDLGKAVMAQPYQRFIDDRGETGLVYFGGELSHAFRKNAILTDGEMVFNELFAVEEISARIPNDQEIELGDQVMAHIIRRWGTAPLYSRVDVVKGSRGVPVVMEVEMAEPSFFFHTSVGSPERFVRAFLAG